MNSWIRCSLAVGVAMVVGCAPPAEPQAEPPEKVAESSGGHDHAHEELGPHGGHMLHMEPSGGHAEWTHDDDSHLITVYLNDFEAEKVNGAKFVAKIGDEVEEFPLEAGEGDAWTVTSETLMTHINMGEAAVVQLVVEDESGEQTSTVEAHEHHHH